MFSGIDLILIAFTEEGRENVEAVQKIAIEKKLKWAWISPEEAINISEFRDYVVYVTDPIEGEAAGQVVDHLVSLNYPVIGPQCALTVLKHGIPLKQNQKYPVYTLTMLDTVVCFSNILSDERERLVRRVELMGGKVSRPLYHAVTHLVVGEVGSVKYFTATSYDINIMVKGWIDHLWKYGVSRYIRAIDGKWEEFLCPVFLGCSVCLTGFGASEKARIQKLVTKFGGEYSGSMKLNHTTHLIVNKPEGQKYAMASKFGVKIVNVNWIYDSVEKKACQDNNKYPVKVEGYKKSVNQSTPENHGKRAAIESMDVSCIDPSMVNETVASTMNDTRMSSIGIPSSSFLPPPTSSQLTVTGSNSKQALIAFPLDRDYSDILDGINAYLVGFAPNEEEKMRQLLSVAGAIKYNQLTSSVSHVIVGPSSMISNSLKSQILSANEQNPDLCAVSYSWILECLNNGELVLEKDHWDKDLLPPPTAHEMDVDHEMSTRDADDTTVLQHKTIVKKGVTQMEKQDRDGSMLGFLPPGDVDDDEMLSQYMNPQAGKDATSHHAPEVGETMNEDSSFMQRDHIQKFNNLTTAADVDETEAPQDETTAMETSTMQNETTVNECFTGKTFIVLGFVGDELQHLMSEIESNGGCLLAVNSKRIADYAIVPLTGWPVDRTVQDIVTDYWLKLCISEGHLASPTEHTMCTPFSVPPDSMPLQGCVTCLSKYISLERTYLSRLIEDLGGLNQEIVARRNINNMKQTTHLIIAEPGGDKYTGCKNWGMFIVTAEWVYECARKGRKLDEEQFSVDKPVINKPCLNPDPLPPQKTSNTAAEVFAKAEALTKGSKLKQQTYSNWNQEFPPMPRPPSVVDKIRKRLEAKADAERKAREEAIKNKETPLRVRYKRLRLETPSKFMTKGAAPVNVSFDLTEVFELLKTPKEQQKEIWKQIKNNPETPMSEFISRCLDEAVANIPGHLIQNLEKKLNDSLGGEENDAVVGDLDSAKNGSADEEKGSTIFENLVISLAKKLHNQFSELSKTVTLHGGEFRWTYDNACTHLLFQGRLNDKNKEFCMAKKEGKLIVSPHWVKACIQTNFRIDETLFPHVYDPNKSIQMVKSSPPKTRRRTLRNSTASLNKTSSSTKSEASSASTESEEDAMPKANKDAKIDADDSQEARENLRKKLEHIMSATNAIKGVHKHRLSCSTTNTPSPSVAAAHRRTAVGTPLPIKDIDPDKTELSQDVQVSWDDPTGREEMERLMRENETTHNDSSFKMPDDLSHLQSDHDVTVDMPPEAEEEETDPDVPDVIRAGMTPCFIMSSVAPQEKAHYASIINELGGEYLESGFLDPRSTHLLVAKPARSEKFLSALASGKWVLSTRYMAACKEAQKFIKENEYEYGNPMNPETESLLQKPEDLQVQMSMAVHRWRKKLESKAKDTGVCEGAFSGWKVLLHVNERQLKGFERLLQCGSAEVVASQLPYHGKPADITHAFIDAEKVKLLDESCIEKLVDRTGIHVCLPTYIGEYLIKDPPPEPHTHYLPQVAAILHKIDQENDGRENKRRKIEGKSF